MNRITRRRFVQALGAGGLTYALGRTSGTVWAQAAGVNGFSDYKALVCVFLFGGNDSWSMVVPRSAAEYNAYAQSRQNLAIPLDQLIPVNALNGNGVQYGLHPSMTGIASLFESARCAVMANVGPLIAPTTKAQYQAGSVPLPPQLTMRTGMPAARQRSALSVSRAIEAAATRRRSSGEGADSE